MWLPVADWQPDTVCSVRGREARLVLLQAVCPGNGALTRTLAMLAVEGLRPTVVDPTKELAAALSRRGWRGRTHGSNFETFESRWRPMT